MHVSWTAKFPFKVSFFVYFTALTLKPLAAESLSRAGQVMEVAWGSASPSRGSQVLQQCSQLSARRSTQKTSDSRSHTRPTPGINNIWTLLVQSINATRLRSTLRAQIIIIIFFQTATHCSPLSAPPLSSSSNHNRPAIFFCIQLLTRQSGDSWSPRDCCKQVQNAILAPLDQPQ